MKKNSTFLFLLCLLAICNPLKAQYKSDSLTNRLSKLLEQWHLDAASANHEAYINTMSHEGVFIGTDASEYWTTSEFREWTKPYFDRKNSWSFKTIQRNIYLSAERHIAWFDELLETKMGICRGSGVLQETGGVWEIEQYVLSPTVPNDLMKQVARMKGLEDSLLIPYLKWRIKDPEKSMKLKGIFDKHGMTGTIIIYDPTSNEYSGFNPAWWDNGYLPASTFKIPNSLIGLELGLVDTGYVFNWNGEDRRMPQWKRDLTLKEAFAVSCVPCYQELARRIGVDRMNEYLLKLQFGKMDVHAENIDLFWLEGKSRITPFEQVSFLRKLYEERLPLKKSTIRSMKAMMINETGQEYTLSGKTGWAVRNDNNYGWFVGYLETGEKVFFVATLIEPKNHEMVNDFALARKKVTMEVFRELGLVK